MNHRDENKLSYLEQLRSGRPREGRLASNLAPWYLFLPPGSPPSVAPWKGQRCAPPLLGEGAQLPAKQHAGIQPGELPAARRLALQAHWTRYSIQPRTSSDPGTGRHCQPLPGARTPHSPGVPGSLRLSDRVMWLWVGSAQSSNLQSGDPAPTHHDLPS